MAGLSNSFEDKAMRDTECYLEPVYVNLQAAKDVPESPPREPAYINAVMGQKLAMTADNTIEGFGEMPEKLGSGTQAAPSNLKSRGSSGHPHNCRECFFLMFHDGGCKAGKDCKYCHEFHPRANPRKNRQHMAKWSMAAECDTTGNKAYPPSPAKEQPMPRMTPPGINLPTSAVCGSGCSNSSLDVQSRMLKYNNIFQQNAHNIQRFMQEYVNNGTPDATIKDAPSDATPTKKVVAPRARAMEVVVGSKEKDESSDEGFSPKTFDQGSFLVSTEAGSSRQVSASTDDSLNVEEGSPGLVHPPKERRDSISLRYSEDDDLQQDTPTVLTFIAGAHSHIPAQVTIPNEQQEELREHFKFAVKPALPEGLHICGRTGAISGRPLRTQQATEHCVTISIAAMGASGGTTLGMARLASCPIRVRVLDLLDYTVSPVTSKDEECSQIVLTLNRI